MSFHTQTKESLEKLEQHFEKKKNLRNDNWFVKKEKQKKFLEVLELKNVDWKRKESTERFQKNKRYF